VDLFSLRLHLNTDSRSSSLLNRYIYYLCMYVKDSFEPDTFLSILCYVISVCVTSSFFYQG